MTVSSDLFLLLITMDLMACFGMSEGVVDEHEMIEGTNFAGIGQPSGALGGGFFTINTVPIVNGVVESANTIGAISQSSQPPTRHTIKFFWVLLYVLRCGRDTLCN